MTNRQVSGYFRNHCPDASRLVSGCFRIRRPDMPEYAIGEGTLADAILDRIVHDSYTILIDGEESMRKRKGIID